MEGLSGFTGRYTSKGRKLKCVAFLAYNNHCTTSTSSSSSTQSTTIIIPHPHLLVHPLKVQPLWHHNHLFQFIHLKCHIHPKSGPKRDLATVEFTLAADMGLRCSHGSHWKLPGDVSRGRHHHNATPIHLIFKHALEPAP